MAAELTPTIAAHTASALAALAVGSLQLARKKGDFAHRSLGRVWFATAAVAVLSSFFIFEIRPGRPSAIHLLSLATAFFMALSIFRLAPQKHRRPQEINDRGVLRLCRRRRLLVHAGAIVA